MSSSWLGDSASPKVDVITSESLLLDSSCRENMAPLLADDDFFRRLDLFSEILAKKDKRFIRESSLTLGQGLCVFVLE